MSGRMLRRRTWENRLVAWEREVLGEPFEWGRTDCVSLARGALEAMYEDPPVPTLGPDYETADGARRAHVETDGPEAVLRAGGAEEVGLGFARDGDMLIGVEEAGGIEGVAVVVESYYVVASEEEGVLRRPLEPLRREDPEDVTCLRPPEEGEGR